MIYLYHHDTVSLSTFSIYIYIYMSLHAIWCPDIVVRPWWVMANGSIWATRGTLSQLFSVLVVVAFFFSMSLMHLKIEPSAMASLWVMLCWKKGALLPYIPAKGPVRYEIKRQHTSDYCFAAPYLFRTPTWGWRFFSNQDFPLLAVHLAQQRASSSDRIVQSFAAPPPCHYTCIH